ncbi:hypothetical protein HYPSUDRAFT_59022 [Hypholoma sublateritium FD-334 SS-4]|uniref:Uncharacterized protein n=1 Tax=Hypholoma sublateritium (strain FD-334 SS-4) TaxID=945553 RepID=A0A0D2LW38_HYPSF|nr:hypothetical protein HYPSUDRAFT_59022 [Hypholoma sublateritium FD-334 SS-4]
MSDNTIAVIERITQRLDQLLADNNEIRNENARISNELQHIAQLRVQDQTIIEDLNKKLQEAHTSLKATAEDLLLVKREKDVLEGNCLSISGEILKFANRRQLTLGDGVEGARLGRLSGDGAGAEASSGILLRRLGLRISEVERGHRWLARSGGMAPIASISTSTVAYTDVCERRLATPHHRISCANDESVDSSSAPLASWSTGYAFVLPSRGARRGPAGKSNCAGITCRARYAYGVGHRHQPLKKCSSETSDRALSLPHPVYGSGVMKMSFLIVTGKAPNNAGGSPQTGTPIEVRHRAHAGLGGDDARTARVE